MMRTFLIASGMRFRRQKTQAYVTKPHEEWSCKSRRFGIFTGRFLHIQINLKAENHDVSHYDQNLSQVYNEHKAFL